MGMQACRERGNSNINQTVVICYPTFLAKAFTALEIMRQLASNAQVQKFGLPKSHIAKTTSTRFARVRKCHMYQPM